MIINGGGGGGGGSGGGKATNGLRLTLTAATPITTTDVTAASTVYFTPYLSNEIALYDGSSSWTVRSTAEVSLALGTLTSGKNYDVFAYWTGTAVALELSAAWTDDTTRSDAVSRQDGVFVKTGATTRRLVGTVRTTSTTTTEDSIAKRFVSNMDNRQPRRVAVFDSTDTWTYGTATWRAARGQSGNSIQFVDCRGDTYAKFRVTALQSGGGSGVAAVGVGIDSTTVNSAQLGLGAYSFSSGTLVHSEYGGVVGVGAHTITWLEYVSAGTTTFSGDDGRPGVEQFGMQGDIWN